MHLLLILVQAVMAAETVDLPDHQTLELRELVGNTYMLTDGRSRVSLLAYGWGPCVRPLAWPSVPIDLADFQHFDGVPTRWRDNYLEVRVRCGLVKVRKASLSPAAAVALGPDSDIWTSAALANYNAESPIGYKVKRAYTKGLWVERGVGTVLGLAVGGLAGMGLGDVGASACRFGNDPYCTYGPVGRGFLVGAVAGMVGGNLGLLHLARSTRISRVRAHNERLAALESE